MATPNELDFSLEDAGGLIPLGAQKQAPVRFGSSPTLQGSETIMSLAALGIFGAQWRDAAQFALAMLLGSLGGSGAKASSPSQLLTETVDTLVGVTEDQFLASLTEDDYQRLVVSLDKLIDVVGENENHLLTPLMDFIGNLIEKYEEESGMTTRNKPLGKEEPETALGSDLYLPARGLEAAYSDDEPEYTVDMLIAVNPDYKEDDVNLDSGLRSSARGLEAAYSDDEPEYTTDMLIEVNPDYAKSQT